MKPVILAAVCAAMLSGCATTQRMDFQDLNNYKVDCANKEAQIRFLESQLTTRDDQWKALFSLGNLTNDPQIRHVKDRSYNAVARTILWDIRTYCP